MGTKTQAIKQSQQRTKKVSFCCPHHGILHNSVEYFSAATRTKILVDIPVMYCQACKKYYTPFTNLLALFNLQYKGQKVMASQGHAEKSIPREEVRVPHFSDLTTEDENKQKEQIRMDQAEKYNQYVEGLRAVNHDCMILTNKPCFVREHKCPNCHETAKKERVKIVQRGKYLLANIRHCNRCGFDYITPEQVNTLCEKAVEKIHGHYYSPFVSPAAIRCELGENNNYLFIPEWATDYEKYDHHHLPPKGDVFYDMTSEEYFWVIMYYRPEEFLGKLRTKSFLGEAGYSTSEPESLRHKILAACVGEHGKSKVINQLRLNINLRIKQKDGSLRYEHAINTWRRDIWHVENQL